MAGFQRRLRGGARRRATARRPFRLPFIDGDNPAALVSALLAASKHGVVVQEGRRFYLVTRGMLSRPIETAGAAGSLARAVGREIAAAAGAVTGEAAEDRGFKAAGRTPVRKDELRVGEAILSSRLEMVAASLRAPVAVVVCSKNPRHVYAAARRLKLCPLDDAPLTRVELD